MMRGTKHSDPAILRFGIFELTPHKHELRRAGVLPNVQEQPSKLLVLVAERSGWNGAPSPESAAPTWNRTSRSRVSLGEQTFFLLNFQLTIRVSQRMAVRWSQRPHEACLCNERQQAAH